MKRFLCLTALCCTFAIGSRACDLCGCYTPQLETMSMVSPETTLGQQAGMAMQSWRERLYFAVGEQFTYFNTVQVDGQEVPNETDQYLASSITQLVAGYAFNSRFALQLNVPLIYRSFLRPDGFAIDRGTVSGLGDVSLLLQSVLFHYTSGPRREMHFEPGNKSPVAD